MPSLFNAQDRQALAARIHRLTPDAERRWGTMSASKMICHVGDQLRIALGDLPTSSGTGPLSWPGIKHLAIYVVPWPKGRIQTAPVMLTTEPDTFETDCENLVALMDRFAQRGADATWAPHPLFGKLSGKSWGALSGRHIDYHLQQFGA